mgnify:CR=1 FL=1
MCSINHDLKAIFIHIHKTGGTTIAMNLKKYYGFETFYIRRPDHQKFCFDKKKKKYINFENRVHGIINYFKTSKYINKKMNMNDDKWEKYYKFCFIRNPYDRIVSAWNHINRFNIPFKNYLNLKDKCNDVEYIHMFMPQYRSMINEKARKFIDFIGYFENLDNDFEKVLKNIGIINIMHNNKNKLNVRKHKPFFEYYDQDSLNKVNILMKEDFDNLNYEKIDNIYNFYEYYSKDVK